MAPVPIFKVILVIVLLSQKGCIGTTAQTNRSAALDQNNDTRGVNNNDFNKDHSDLDHTSLDFFQKTTSLKWSPAYTKRCRLHTTDAHAHATVRSLLQRRVKLIEYTFSIKNHDANPLLINSTWNYKLHKWARVSHSHGLTIMSLAFNYGVLSLTTLSFGIAKLNFELTEQPAGCLMNLTESEKVKVMLDLTLRDFNNKGSFLVYDGDAVCHQIIQNHGGRAKFTDQCCYLERRRGSVRCLVNQPNTWLTIIRWLVSLMTVMVVLFGVLVVIMLFPGAGAGVIRYVVKLKEPLYKSLCVVRGSKSDEIEVIPEHRHFIDLRKETCFPAAKHMCGYLPSGMKIPVKISEYNILVNYNKLLPENSVHVGLVASLWRAICLCEIGNISAFQDCCEANICGCVRETRPIMWISVCRVVGRIIMVLFLPVPFYIRLVMYVMFEEKEVLDRQRAVTNVGLQNWFEFNILQWLTPVHPVFLTAYVMYYSISLLLIYSSVSRGSSRFKRIIADSFKDLNSLHWLAALRMLTRNFLWPFRTMGIFGVFFGLIYWPLVMPISIVACAIYCSPLTFVTCRMFINAMQTESNSKRDIELPGELSDGKTGMKLFEAENFMNACSLFEKRDLLRGCNVTKTFTRERFTNVCLALTGVFTVCAVTLAVSECANFILHVCVFTLMGMIVNASKVLKYGALLFMVVLYGYDCCNNVYRQYLKLNKGLFSEIKGRIKDISEVTMLPSYLQQNRGFKSQENSEQADYETEDNLSTGESKQWEINDLTLFVDNNDVPRIPKELFEQVCDIEVPGSPGPVYRSLLAAMGKLFMITLFLIFVFLIVLAFGDVYKISPTNQVIATMAGGSVPFVIMKLLKPAEPDIELHSVSFQGKLNEIVVNFRQSWPMYDFSFDIEEEPEEGEGDTDKPDGGTTPASNKDSNFLSVKEERSRMTQSVAELMEIPCEKGLSRKDIMETLMQAKSYGPADRQQVDIVIYLPHEEEPPYFKIDLTPPSEDLHGESFHLFNNKL